MARPARRPRAKACGLSRRQAGGGYERRETRSRKPLPTLLRACQGGPTMNRGLLIRAFRESWPTTLLLGLVLMGVEAAMAFVLPKFGSQMSEQWLQLDFARGIMQAMLGTEIGDRLGPQMFQSIAWVHPVALALTWAHALVSCTRVPAGEVDRGTADVLLGLPVSRWEVFLSETMVWLACGAAILAAALAGNLLGAHGLPPERRPQLLRLFIVLANLFC